MTTSEWLDRLAPKATAVVAVGTCATYGGIHAMAGNPTGAMGVPDYLGWDWKSKAGLPIVCVPGCPIHPDNLSETLALPALPGRRPGADDPARRGAAAARGCSARPCTRAATAAGYYEQGEFADRVRLAEVPGQARLLGPGRQVQRAQARLDQRRRRLPERRRHLHRLHDARLPGQVHAVHGRAARRARSRRPRAAAYGTVDPARCAAITENTLDKEPKWRAHGPRAHDRLPEELVTDDAR